MEKTIQYAKTSHDIRVAERIVMFLRRWWVSESLIQQVEREIGHPGVTRYPDGKWEPEKDISEFSNY
jgi:hypothetical protein